MVLGVVAGLKDRELVMANVVVGDCRDKMADRWPKVAHLLKDGEEKEEPHE